MPSAAARSAIERSEFSTISTKNALQSAVIRVHAARRDAYVRGVATEVELIQVPCIDCDPETLFYLY